MSVKNVPVKGDAGKVKEGAGVEEKPVDKKIEKKPEPKPAPLANVPSGGDFGIDKPAGTR